MLRVFSSRIAARRCFDSWRTASRAACRSASTASNSLSRRFFSSGGRPSLSTLTRRLKRRRRKRWKISSSASHSGSWRRACSVLISSSKSALNSWRREAIFRALVSASSRLRDWRWISPAWRAWATNERASGAARFGGVSVRVSGCGALTGGGSAKGGNSSFTLASEARERISSSSSDNAFAPGWREARWSRSA